MYWNVEGEKRCRDPDWAPEGDTKPGCIRGEIHNIRCSMKIMHSGQDRLAGSKRQSRKMDRPAENGRWSKGASPSEPNCERFHETSSDRVRHI